MSKENGTQLELFKISTVSDLTGFSPTVLRAWERRYDFLEPERMPGGHRMYTRDDLRVLQRVRELLDQGHSVGELANQGRRWLLSYQATRPNDRRWVESARSLVSHPLESYRVDRYRGESLGVSLLSLSPQDLTTVSLLYERVRQVYELWRYMDQDARDPQLLWQHLSAILDGELQERIARLGTATNTTEKLVLAALADTKYGAFGPLQKFLSQPYERNEENLIRAVTLCRDQAKMLRNAFFDLDTSLRSADEAGKVHSIRSVVDKLESLAFGIEAELEYNGPITSRCLETSAVDRILYNLLQKLERLGLRRAKLWVGECEGGLIRFAFHHESQQTIPLEKDELPSVAVGLSVGISAGAALERGFLGSKPGWSWFHWPVLIPPPTAAICDCEL